MEPEPLLLGDVLDECLESAIPVNAVLVVSLRDPGTPDGVRVVPVTGLTVVPADGSGPSTITFHAGEPDDADGG